MGGTPRSTLLINVGVVVLIAVGLWAAFKSSGSEPTPPAPSPEEKAAPLTASSSLAAPNSDDETAIRATVTRYITRSEPADCRRVYTQHRLNQRFDGSGRKAIEACKEEASENAIPDPDEAVIQSVAIKADRATVVAGATGSIFTGRVDTIKLVRAGGRWKIHAIAKVEIDRKLYERSSYDLLVGRGFTKQEAGCLIDAEARHVTTKELEREAATGKDPDEKEADKYVRRCLGAETLKRVFLKQMREEARIRGLPPSLTNCAMRRLLEGLSGSELRDVVFGESLPSAELSGLFAACAASL